MQGFKRGCRAGAIELEHSVPSGRSIEAQAAHLWCQWQQFRCSWWTRPGCCSRRRRCWRRWWSAARWGWCSPRRSRLHLTLWQQPCAAGSTGEGPQVPCFAYQCWEVLPAVHLICIATGRATACHKVPRERCTKKNYQPQQTATLMRSSTVISALAPSAHAHRRCKCLYPGFHVQEGAVRCTWCCRCR